MPKDGANKSVSTEDDPRRAAGQKVRMMILGRFPSIGHFVKEKNINDTEAKALSRIFSGRKQINLHFAQILSEEFGEDVDHWLALEHKILAIEPQNMKRCQPSENNQEKEDEAMSENDSVPKRSGENEMAQNVALLRVSFRGATVEYPPNTPPEEFARFVRALVDDGPPLS